ncbi:hypothetical protein SteCoe_6675 [Stentor coeruleus]|uniref:Serine aminopeptidase S33 domain-containing protein n=1 Tax=Stentor coeruleus TaxID=5963 RepID=A0A1R2CPI9_9CILI|nr:hypothetical protein SteCoe_6675 [Stentor coeruleus]
MPCIVYCHGNSGSRLDCLDILEHLLPLNISILALDFSGSGQSDGDYVSMGHYEKDDIKVVVQYLERLGTSHIGLWGRSMGAVSALLYSSYSRNIDFIIAESPFASLRTLCVELVNTHTKIPKILAQLLVSRLRSGVKKTAKFDIDDVELIKRIHKVKCPVLLLHSNEDELIPITHAQALMKEAKGNFAFIETCGSHNCQRLPENINKIVSFLIENIEEKPYEEECTEDIMPSIHCTNSFSLRNLNLRKDTERKNNAGQYFKLAQKALKKEEK